MKALITGADGFIASHLIDLILEYGGCEVYGTVRRLADRKNIEHVMDRIEVIDMELTDYHSVVHAIEQAKPDKIFHLAGQTFVPTSWTSPAGTMEINAVGTIHVLEAARRVVPDAYIQLASSSETYGLVHPEEVPILEDIQPLRPLSPYGVSKAAVDYLGWQYARSYKMNIIRTRTFNNDGPRRGEDFVTSNFAKQVALNIVNAPMRPIRHGNLDAIRDFTDVRDTVLAYWMLSEAENTRGDVFNVCTGKGHTMKEVLTELIRLSGIQMPTEVDESRMRPSDVPILIGCPAKIQAHIHWVPRYSFEQTLSDLLDYWLESLQ